MERALQLRTRGPAETRRLAAAVARVLRPGDVVSLTGELGAGKTCFVQGAAQALGVNDRVTSPSFLLRRDYEGDVPVLHLDVYRLDTLQEVVDIGFDDATDARRITFIEWGDAVRQLLPADHLEVELCLESADAAVQEGVDVGDDGDATRVVRIRAHGDDWRRRIVALDAEVDGWGEASAEDGG